VRRNRLVAPSPRSRSLVALPVVTSRARLCRFVSAIVPVLAITVDAARARAGSLAYETAVEATERHRVPILVALAVVTVLAFGSHLALRARPGWLKVRLACRALFLLVSTYWLAFEGGCPIVWRRGGMWNAPVDLRLVVAAAGATAVAISSLWITWHRRNRSRP
jgi:hypothetical protein